MREAASLLLVDGFSLLRRIYEAVPGKDDDKKADGAIASMTSSLNRALREHKPSHFLCAFDHGGETWRHRLYEAYKQNRTPMATALRDRVPGLMDALNARGLRTVSVPDVEAEDVVATLGCKAVIRGFKVTLLSCDKDTLPLLDFGIAIYNHFDGRRYDHEYVRAKFGVEPKQIADFLALMGDERDGIPGVPGIGMKTAAKLLDEHQTVHGVLEAAVDIKGEVGKKIRHYGPDAELCLKLSTLKFDVDLGFLTPRDLEIPRETLLEAVKPPSPSAAARRRHAP